MIKSFLITTMAPYMGTEQHYGAYAEDIDTLTQWLYDNWYDEECNDLYDSYGFRWEDSYDEEYEEVKDEYEDFEDFCEAKYQEWCEECSMDVEECPEEDFADYVPGGEGKLEIIYDERQNS